MRYTVVFRKDGTPKTGLSPTIDIHRKISDWTSAGAAATVYEASSSDAPGVYYFDVTPTERRLVRVNSGDVTMADSERYIYLEVDAHDDGLNMLYKILTGRWKITAGSNTMTFYDEDGTTPILTFTLKDSAGSPSHVEVYERAP